MSLYGKHRASVSNLIYMCNVQQEKKKKKKKHDSSKMYHNFYNYIKSTSYINKLWSEWIL